MNDLFTFSNVSIILLSCQVSFSDICQVKAGSLLNHSQSEDVNTSDVFTCFATLPGTKVYDNHFVALSSGTLLVLIIKYFKYCLLACRTSEFCLPTYWECLHKPVCQRPSKQMSQFRIRRDIQRGNLLLIGR